MIRQWFAPPEAECPKCGESRAMWRTGKLWFLLARLGNLARRLTAVGLKCRNCRCSFEHLCVLPRTVIGYQGCRQSFAQKLISGSLLVKDWKPSRNDYDWLGEGVYFWEHAPGRAWQWAKQRYKSEAAVVAAEIRLGRCLDLADTVFTRLLAEAYADTLALYQANGWPMPANEGKEQKLRRLDRLVIDRVTKRSDSATELYYQTIRCPFEEGDRAYPGGMIRTQSHIQIAVRERACIASRIHMVPLEGVTS